MKLAWLRPRHNCQKLSIIIFEKIFWGALLQFTILFCWPQIITNSLRQVWGWGATLQGPARCSEQVFPLGRQVQLIEWACWVSQVGISVPLTGHQTQRHDTWRGETQLVILMTLFNTITIIPFILMLTEIFFLTFLTLRWHILRAVFGASAVWFYPARVWWVGIPSWRRHHCDWPLRPALVDGRGWEQEGTVPSNVRSSIPRLNADSATLKHSLAVALGTA